MKTSLLFFLIYKIKTGTRADMINMPLSHFKKELNPKKD